MPSNQHPFLQEDPFPAVPRSTSWSTIGTSSTHTRTKSNNPYRQNLDVVDSPSGIRKPTPVRAVFDDLPTAHSSITSGKLPKPRRRKSRNEATQNLDEDDSIPLKELDVSKRPVDFVHNLPLPPLPAMVLDKQHHGIERAISSEGNSGRNHRLRRSQTLQTPTIAGPSNSMFTNIKTGLASISSPLAREDTSDRPKSGSWPRDSFDLGDQKRGNVRNIEDRPEGSHANNSTIYRSNIGDSTGMTLPSSMQHGAIQSSADLLSEENIESNNGAGLLDFSLPPPANNMQTPEQSNYRALSNDGSLPEGSTVGNIYKHYVREDGLDQFSEDEDNDDESEYSLPKLKNYATSSNSIPNGPLRPSALLIRKQHRTQGEPPKFALPSVPNISSHRIVPSSTQGLGRSSSYGDTHNLLDLTQPTGLTGWHGMRGPLSRSIGRHDLQSDQAISEGEEPESVLPQVINNNNPFLSPKVVISPADDSIVLYDDAPNFSYPIAERMPLEREVSNALRRASGYSTYSDGSISSSLLDRYEGMSRVSSSKSIAVLRRQKIEDTPPSDVESMGDDTKVVVQQAKAFYDQGAIASNWLTTRKQNVVRVPINHNGSMPDSPPDSPPHATPAPSRRHQAPEDDHDWETVGESGFGLEIKSSKETGLLGGTINRAGSSLANTSDEGTVSSHVPEIEDFGSTERITQHPGHIRYFGDYRQRDLKKTNIPVFLPVFRDHKVNGYLADSTRMRPPPPPFYISPPELDRSHKNPFRSSPPVAIKPTVRAVRPSGRTQYPNRPGALQPSLQTVHTECDDNQEITGGTVNRVRRNTYDWMDDFGEPGPAIDNRREYQRSPSPKRPGNGHHDIGTSSKTEVTINNNESTFTTDSNPPTSGFRHKLLSVSKLQGMAGIRGIAESSTRRSLTNKKTRSRVPMVKGPPGAFYQGLRAKPSVSKQRQMSEQRDGAGSLGHRADGRKYPTNALRPLSLLKDQRRPSTPANQTEHRPSQDVFTNDFVYRSPLAPLKRNSWKKLYSPQQLKGMQEAAKIDGFIDAQNQTATGLLRGVTKESGSRKHLFETPTLRLWKRDNSTRTDLTHRKTNISITVLFLCGLFPPMLVLYAMGSLDGIMVWWTEGEFTNFAKTQRKWAYVLMCCWALAIILGLIIFLVYWFAGLRQRT